MKRSLVILGYAMLAAACGDDKKGPTFWDDRPADGWYVVAVQPLENTCSDDAQEPTPRVFMDFFLRMDGLYDISHGSLAVPGMATPKGVSWKGGNIDYADEWTSGNTDYALRIKGILTPDEVDLNWRFDGYPKCHITAQITGTPWPLRDPVSLEGFYGLTVTPWGHACGSDARVADAPRNVVSTLSAAMDGNYFLGLFDGLYARIGPPAADGALDWTGQVMLPTGFFDIPLEATLAGTLSPAVTDLTLNLWEIGESSASTDCTFQDTLVGAKRLPSFAATDNDYRMRYWVHDGCADDPEKVDRQLDATARVITQPDGTVQILDPAGVPLLTNANGALSAQFGSAASDGFVGTLTGTLAPPSLSYALDYDVYDQSGNVACVFSVTADGLVRYVFE